MNRYEIFYIAGITLIILTFLIYLIGTLIFVSSDDGTVTNLLGKEFILDADYDARTTAPAIATMNKAHYHRLLWVGIPAGLVLLFTGILLKRKAEGPDLFLDEDIDEIDVEE